MRIHESPNPNRDALLDGLTPRAIVQQLDNYIVGQSEAKRAVAVALRDRWRRRSLTAEMRAEVMPKNIIMIGPTGVGKTEIARRLAGLTGAPFVKVEASHYTEVGYHGRDVESMVRELVNVAANLVRTEMLEQMRPAAESAAEERLLSALYDDGDDEHDPFDEDASERTARRQRARDKLRKMLRAGKLDAREVQIETQQKPSVVQGFSMGGEEMGIDMQTLFEEMIPARSETRGMTVAEARRVLQQQECERLIDRHDISTRAVSLAEEGGIIFIDELDKIAGGARSTSGPDVSREGVQRDLLPIVEGCSVQTRHGTVHTDHVLFIAAGAFNVSKPSDLIPELQGRFPIRVELSELTREDLVRILREPKNALTRQYQAMLGTEGITLKFTDDAIEHLGALAEEVNRRTQSIGARRLYTVMEKLLEEISFDAPEMPRKKITIDRTFVENQLADLVQDEDLAQYIL